MPSGTFRAIAERLCPTMQAKTGKMTRYTSVVELPFRMGQAAFSRRPLWAVTGVQAIYAQQNNVPKRHKAGKGPLVTMRMGSNTDSLLISPAGSPMQVQILVLRDTA